MCVQGSVVLIHLRKT